MNNHICKALDGLIDYKVAIIRQELPHATLEDAVRYITTHPDPHREYALYCKYREDCPVAIEYNYLRLAEKVFGR
jgi:hypothetical protein